MPPFLEAKHYIHFKPSEITQINWAYAYAHTVLYGQMRKNGTLYIEHPVRMVSIQLDRLKVYDAELSLILIFHDVDEESELMFVSDTVGAWFGLKQKHHMGMLTKTKENESTYLSAIINSGNWRLILAKLIDRTDNMETLAGLEVDFQKKQAKETRELFLDMCKVLEKVIPVEYREVPKIIHKRLAVLCEQYGC